MSVLVLHCYTTPYGQRILQGLLDSLNDYTGSVIISTVGEPLHSIESSLDYSIVNHGNHPEWFEFPSLLLVESIAHQYPNTIIGYAHTKGVTHEGLDSQTLTTDWRKSMEWYCLRNHRLCHSILNEGYTTVGAFLVNDPSFFAYAFYAGNFWWTTSEHVKSLTNLTQWCTEVKQAMKPEQYRYMAEFWILSNKDKPYSLYDYEASPSSMYDYFIRPTAQSIHKRVINLKRRPERLHSFRTVVPSGLRDTAVFEAFDGSVEGFEKGFDWSILKNRDYETLFESNDYHDKPSIKANALGHLTLWHECIRLNEPMIVFEDDALFNVNATAVLERILDRVPLDYDILYLGGGDCIPSMTNAPQCILREAEKEHCMEIINQSIGVPSLDSVYSQWMLQCYCISPKGAQRLLTIADRVGVYKTIDSWIKEWFFELECYTSIPLIVYSRRKADDECT